MGKIRRARTKRHIEAAKPYSEGNEKDMNFSPNESELPAVFPVNNLFKTVKEKVKGPVLVNNQLEIKDEELQSRTKKDRRKIRHEKFLKKLHASKIVEENDKKAKERQKTVITGDLNPLTLALQDIDSFSFLCQIDKNKRKNNKKKTKKPSNSSEKRRQKAQLSDMERFQQVLDHPAFQSNPLATIDEHVRNVIKTEANKI